MAMIGEALLSATIGTLLDKITSGESRDFFKKKKLNVSLLHELERTLLALNALLNDAEEKEISNLHVRKWLDKLEDAILDAEDLLDEINYDSLRGKVEAESQTTTKKVWKFLSPTSNQFYREMNSKMEEMCHRLKTFLDMRDILGLQSVSVRMPKRTPTTPLVNESNMVGRMKDMDRLKTMLLSPYHANSYNTEVIAILGMGGIGKTTLAQLLYNDEDVQKHFDLKAWACVSVDFDVISVTKTLLESVTSEETKNDNLGLLQDKLKRTLGEKKFLLVLDDLWNEKYDNWDNLRIPFFGGKMGSKIIVTTRLEQVAKMSRPIHIHRLQPLSQNECWRLLAKHAFGSEDPSRYPDLENIGKEIASKCGGLPLAAKTLGGLLCSRLDKNMWNKVLNSNLWDSPNDDVLPALRLSYLYLPAHLKRCFAYCSIFPKGYQLDRKKLVLLWMAEGLLAGGSHDYFSELLSRSLIQVQSSKDVEEDKFVMHDLVNDLAIAVSKKGYFRCDGNKIPENTRHLSYKQDEYDDCNKFENFHSLKCLRSFLPLASYWAEGYLSKKILNELLPIQKSLRVLTLSKYKNITELPNSIKNLVHLRYLDLSGTRIKRLPDTICTLYNLQTLILSRCDLLDELPTHIGKLINLHHLDISGCKLKVMPVQIGRLQNLLTSITFVVGKQRDSPSVRELAKFPHLQGELSILELRDSPSVKEASEAVDANLKRKNKVEELRLEWDENTRCSRIEKEVLDHLQPSAYLRKLTIRGYRGNSFPTWLGDPSFLNMVSLRIDNCNYCEALPPLGQLPLLKELFVSGMNSLKHVDRELYGQSSEPFPSLETLAFKDIENWEQWLPSATEGSKDPFPQLKSLSLSNCPKLRRHLPHHLPSLSSLEIKGCRLLEITSPLHQLTSIKTLRIERVGQLLGDRDEHVSPCSLLDLSIRDCVHLWSLPQTIMRSNCLGHLDLFNLPDLIDFPPQGLPTSLTSLSIDQCPKLKFLHPGTWCRYTSLQYLSIESSCESLQSFCLDSFPALESLKLQSLLRLTSLSESEASVSRPSHLSSLSIIECENLKSLSRMIPRLDKLLRLEIDGLPKLASLYRVCLPVNLQTVKIIGCAILSDVGIANWGLQCLTSLSHLELDGALLKEQLLLPTSLASLTIVNLSNPESLKGNAIQHLTSLKHLEFSHCKLLEFIPEDAFQCFINLEYLSVQHCQMLKSLSENGISHLTNLKELYIHDCRELGSLPEEWLPSSLSRLSIRNCPLLEARYQSQKRKYRSKIAHIPVIEINGEVMIQ